MYPNLVTPSEHRRSTGVICTIRMLILPFRSIS